LRNKNITKEFNYKQWQEPTFPTANAFKDVRGLKIGMITIMLFAGVIDNKSSWHCKCNCGNWILFLKLSYIRSGTKSCGCLHSKTIIKDKTKHKMTKSPEYYSWTNMKTRCYNKNNPKYQVYGKRGIKVCAEWLDKENGFSNFLADMGFKPNSTCSIERIDVNGNYEPSNCIWASPIEQARNKTTTLKITYNGKTQTLKEWSEEVGIKYRSLVARLYSGWSNEDIITIPINSSKNHNKYKKKF